MSLYNMMHGVNPSAFFVLPMLGKHAESYPRFRDCFLADEEHPRYDNHILVYTRVGGGNREDYQEQIDELRASPNYVSDYDDSFDCTFATFVFSVPEEWKEDYGKIKSGKLLEISEAYKKKLYEIYPKLTDKFNEIFNSETTDETSEATRYASSNTDH